MLINVSKRNIAIGGYDVVAYHELIQSPARVGDKKYQAIHDGVIYLFRNEDNKQIFLASPEKYIPMYGGFCATAMSEGNAVPVDPETFLIQDNKLYLFYHDILGNNTLNEWKSNIENRRHQADKIRVANTFHHVGSGVVYSSIITMIRRLFT